MHIRKFKPEDRAALVAHWKQAFPQDPAHNEPSAVIDMKLAVDDLIFVADDSGALVGACIAGYDGHRGWLYAVAVSETVRRKGIGTRLVKAAIDALRALGCIKVNIQIRATNASVAAFYRALGFAAEDRLSMGMLFDSAWHAASRTI